MKSEVINKLDKYAELIHEKNQVMNITGFKTLEAIKKEGIEDSLLAFNYLKNKFLNPNKTIKLLDIGAGAGFPSLPFLITNTEQIDLTIIESQTKRCNFLNNVASNLNLKVEILNLRAEETKKWADSFDFVTARAVSSIKNMYLMAHHLLKNEGYFYLLKGQNYQQELNEFLNSFPNKQKDIIVHDYANVLDQKSYIVMIKKTEKTPPSWPLKWKQIIEY